MSETPIWPYSLAEALRNGGQGLWQASHRENVLCAGAIDQAIAAHFDGSHLNREAIEEVVRQFGFPRVNFVLANTVRQLNDGCFSENNKKWAGSLYLPADEFQGMNLRADYVVRSHPDVVDDFISLARQIYQERGLFDAGHCRSLSGEDLRGQVAVLNLATLKQDYQAPEFQIFLPDDGFGCSPAASGRRVFGIFLKDGVRGSFYRQDFIGLLKDEHMPEWAKEKLAALRAVGTHTETFLCPLAVSWYPPGPGGYPADTPEALEPYAAAPYEEAIRAAINQSSETEDAGRGLMAHYEGSGKVKDKVANCRPDVKRVEDTLYGAFVCQVKGELEPGERAELIQDLSRQARDDWGAAFEQQPIERLEGDLYISFWNGSEDWSLRPEAEVQEHQTMSGGMAMA